ncbi:winged helix-turn-helix domain-containing protein [Deinococcus sp. MIMF12]|uniref:Winged helix-turn-helix domain-containing protein n=1 Tax=Deinococcus rhizophilus TaxID=3049544 RepID=A0ABT7JDI1_9DEIO|nr:winged helix-turn-helix domain-containing protein [Deinococcus rhizophilus]MDL2343105.1 winged helix-turn-helix domain-containing protein [Deinococcus rhizophilus]
MSRGPGRVQRGILEALEDGPLTGPDLARQVGAGEDSTRRALRRLEAGGRVVCLGFALGGGQRWGLPHLREARAALLSPEREAHLAAVMGPRFARSFRRAVVSGL